MSLIDTESLILKTYDLSDADRIVVLLTRDHGIVRGVAKGAKRLKSKYGSSLEPFTNVNVTYFQKESRELVTIDRVDILRSFFRAASDPIFLDKFSYLTDILITFLPPQDPNEVLFRMVKACLESAEEHPGMLPAIGLYFELWLLRLAGYLPDWAACEACGRVFADEEDAAVRPGFHLACDKCRNSSSRMVTARQRQMFRRFRNLSPLSFATEFAGNDGAVFELSSILKGMISQATGKLVSDERVAAAVNNVAPK